MRDRKNEWRVYYHRELDEIWLMARVTKFIWQVYVDDRDCPIMKFPDFYGLTYIGEL